jgi:hypothetical protein
MLAGAGRIFFGIGAKTHAPATGAAEHLAEHFARVAAAGAKASAIVAIAAATGGRRGSLVVGGIVILILLAGKLAELFEQLLERIDLTGGPAVAPALGALAVAEFAHELAKGLVLVPRVLVTGTALLNGLTVLEKPGGGSVVPEFKPVMPGSAGSGLAVLGFGLPGEGEKTGSRRDSGEGDRENHV